MAAAASSRVLVVLACLCTEPVAPLGLLRSELRKVLQICDALLLASVAKNLQIPLEQIMRILSIVKGQ